MIENIGDPFSPHLNQAVENVALERDSLLLAASSNRDPERRKKIVLAFTARRVEGIIVTPSETEDTAYPQAEIDAGVAMVFVDRPAHGIDADLVVTDNAGGAEAGVRHLIEHGHRRIACFTDRAELYTGAERRRGFARALRRAEIPQDPTLMYARNPDELNFTTPLEAMFSGPNPPTAIFAGNNLSTVSIVRILAHHRDWPGYTHSSLALVGFDDFALADALSPAVTVVAHDPEAMGTAAARLLFDRLDGERGAPRTITLGTTLIPRGFGEILHP